MMESDTTSVKSAKSTSTPSSLKPPDFTGGHNKRQVAFQRPKLIIPPPQNADFRKNPSTAGTVYTAKSNNVAYDRKASMFQFSGLKDFTKSGLGIGEKCALWLYHKVRKWSRKWFTHMFLTVVLILYTVGGALVFEFVEGRPQDKILDDIRDLRNKLIDTLEEIYRNKTNSSSLLKVEWDGKSRIEIKEYEKKIIEYDKIYKSTISPMWTFWKAIVFCGTVYTTIVVVISFPLFGKLLRKIRPKTSAKIKQNRIRKIKDNKG